MILHIKNMVCDRCNAAVRSILDSLDISYQSVILGEVESTEKVTGKLRTALKTALQAQGFDLLDDKKSKMIEKVKNILIALVQEEHQLDKINISEYVSQEIAADYGSLSQIFSDQEGYTIEHYFILQRIEKVKELLRYNEMSLSEIAIKMHFSDVAHLSNQFKKVVGCTPTAFKKFQRVDRKPLDAI